MHVAWVTGGAGFIGSHLCEALLTRGDEVHVFDHLSSGRLENVAHLDLRDDFILNRWDVDETPLRDYKGTPPDIIYYLAGHASPRDYGSKPLETLLSSATGLKGALEAAAVHKAPIIFASTSEVYGSPSTVPTPEDALGAVNTLGPRSCYDESKRFGETLCYVYHKTLGVDARIPRIFNTFGPRMRPDDGRVVSTFINQALQKKPVTVQGSGQNTRSFMFVDDCVRGLLAVAEKGAPARAYNLGNPVEISVNDLAAHIARLVGVDLVVSTDPPAPDDPPRRCPDITRAKTELGWEPKVDLETGLQKTIDWFRGHPQ